MAQQNQIKGSESVSQNPLDENSSAAPGSGYKQSEGKQPMETTMTPGQDQPGFDQQDDQDKELSTREYQSDSSDLDSEFDDEQDV